MKQFGPHLDVQFSLQYVEALILDVMDVYGASVLRLGKNLNQPKAASVIVA